jgi:electron transport complex protein RnfC
MLDWILKLISLIYPMAKRGLKKFNGGIFPKSHKDLSNHHPIVKTIMPKELALPLKQHIGIAVEPLVVVGEKVLKNQLIANTEDTSLHAPIHAPTSGTISAIEQRQLPHSSGLTGLCIIITTDGLELEIENALKIPNKVPTEPNTLKNIIYKAGIVGMGGAGFPTFAKIPNEKNKVKTIIINGAECEPFITCDDLIMQTYAKQIISGANIVANALGCNKIICGIEDNKQQAIKKMRQAVNNEKITIKSIPTIYPIGGEKQLIQEILGIEIPAGSHALNSGILVMNVSTVRAIYQAVIEGKPLTSRIVTISGTGLKKPYNTEAMLGTAFIDLIKFAKPKMKLNYRLIQGGPMMGFEVQTNQVPITKTTNCILANTPQKKTATMPCIRCGECMDACPINLLPQQLYWYSKSQEFEKTEKLNLFDCIECGCCSYVCPSNIPLVQYYRFAKAEVKKNKSEQKATSLAKLRYENKLARQEKLKVEKANRLKAKKEAIKQKSLADKDKNITATSSTPPMSAREKALAAAKKRTQQANQITPDKASPAKATPTKAATTAIAAAKKRAALKKIKQQTPNKDTIEDSKPDNRKKAIEAEKKRAALIKTKKSQE